MVVFSHSQTHLYQYQLFSGWTMASWLCMCVCMCVHFVCACFLITRVPCCYKASFLVFFLHFFLVVCEFSCQLHCNVFPVKKIGSEITRFVFNETSDSAHSLIYWFSDFQFAAATDDSASYGALCNLRPICVEAIHNYFATLLRALV